MLQNIEKNQGFSLIELLVAMAIMGGISLVSVRLLYDTLSTRSKQYSIERSTDSIRPIFSTISSAIQSAQSVSVISPTQIKILGNTDSVTGTTPCFQFQHNSINKTIEQISDDSNCNTGVTKMTADNIIINQFQFSSINQGLITISVVGIYKDNMGEHSFNYSTSVVNRISI